MPLRQAVGEVRLAGLVSRFDRLLPKSNFFNAVRGVHRYNAPGNFSRSKSDDGS
jgi:hypothetical protein